MGGFVTSRTAYRRNAVRRTMILRIDEIAVPPRSAGVPDFERDRMVSVLDAIRHDRSLPPIEVSFAIGSRSVLPRPKNPMNRAIFQNPAAASYLFR